MKELTITPPEGYEIDREKSTFEKIVFKPIDIKPRSWEEYCKNFPVKEGEAYITLQGNVSVVQQSFINYIQIRDVVDKNLLPSKEYAEAFLALMQLISLRQAWIGDWKPNWNDCAEVKYIIVLDGPEIVILENRSTSHPLSFQTKKMVKEFRKCFKDLLEQAKILL